MGSHSLLQGIFPTQGSNLALPHCRQILYHLNHQGRPREKDKNPETWWRFGGGKSGEQNKVFREKEETLQRYIQLKKIKDEIQAIGHNSTTLITEQKSENTHMYFFAW